MRYRAYYEFAVSVIAGNEEEAEKEADKAILEEMKSYITYDEVAEQAEGFRVEEEEEE